MKIATLWVARMIIDDARLHPKANNLTLLRLLLAGAVIWTHSFWRATHAPAADFDQFSPWLGRPISAFAVDGFFFLSGFLVYSSLLRRHDVKEFAIARLARLWPGLAVSVVVTILVGALFTTAPGLSYFGGQTAKFAIYNLSLVAPAYMLTGIECGDLSSCAVNQSLWSIPWEVRCYAALIVFSLLGLARPNAMTRLILPATAAFAVLMHFDGAEALLTRFLGKTLTYYLVMSDRLWVMFALGIAAFLWRERIRLSWWWTLGLLAALVITTRLDLEVPHLGQIFTASLVLNLGFLTAARKVVSADWPDYSYGVYIYGFPVMMLIAAALPDLSMPALAAITAIATILPAALSWHLVEKPVLDLVRDQRRARRQEPAAVPLAETSQPTG